MAKSGTSSIERRAEQAWAELEAVEFFEAYPPAARRAARAFLGRQLRRLARGDDEGPPADADRYPGLLLASPSFDPSPVDELTYTSLLEGMAADMFGLFRPRAIDEEWAVAGGRIDLSFRVGRQRYSGAFTTSAYAVDFGFLELIDAALEDHHPPLRLVLHPDPDSTYFVTCTPAALKRAVQAKLLPRTRHSERRPPRREVNTIPAPPRPPKRKKSARPTDFIAPPARVGRSGPADWPLLTEGLGSSHASELRCWIGGFATGQVSAYPTGLRLGERWRHEATPYPLVGSRTLHFVTERTIQTVSLEDGRVLWKHRAPGEIFNTWVFRDRLVVRGDPKRRHEVLDATTGASLVVRRDPGVHPLAAWRGQVLATRWTQADGWAVSPLDLDRLRCGPPLFTTRDLIHCGAVCGDRLYLKVAAAARSEPARLLALDLATGRVLWERGWPDGVDSMLAATEAAVLLAGPRHSDSLPFRVTALGAEDAGPELWSRELRHPLVLGSRVYARDDEASVVALDLRTGEPAWQLDERYDLLALTPGLVWCRTGTWCRARAVAALRQATGEVVARIALPETGSFDADMAVAAHGQLVIRAKKNCWICLSPADAASEAT